MIEAIFTAIFEVIAYIIGEFIVYGFFACIGVVVRRVFFYKKTFEELWKQNTWNALVGAIFFVGILILIAQVV